MAICDQSVPSNDRSMRYPVSFSTPIQASLIWLLEIAVAVRPLGASGRVIASGVVAEAMLLVESRRNETAAATAFGTCEPREKARGVRHFRHNR